MMYSYDNPCVSRKRTVKPKLLALAIASASAVTAGFTATAFAQNPEEDFIPEQLIITGTRIQRKDLISTSPVSTVSDEDIEITGTTNIDELLTRLPQIMPSTGGNTVTNGYDGGASINLRGLGEQRSLTLVNGRRFIPANVNGTVDINSIPTALIERVEIVTGGASAVYGSDAMSGVVNFIMKDDFEGLELSTQYGETGRGDGESWKFGLTMGGNFDNGKGNATLYAGYSKRGQIEQESRDWESNVNGITATGLIDSGSSRIPGGRIGGTKFTEDGDVSRYISAGPADGGDKYNFKPFQDLQSPLTRINLNASMHYDVTDSLRLFAEGSFINTRNTLSLAQQPFELVESVPANDPPTILNYVNHPFLAEGAKDYFRDNFDLGTGSDLVAGDGEATISSSILRRLVEFGSRIREADSNTYRILLGASGDLNDEHSFDVFYSGARLKTVQTLRNGVDENGYRQGVNAMVDPVTGETVCVDQSNGCVPVNMFGANNISPEAVDWLRLDLNNVTTYQLQNIGAVISGTLAELGAGSVGYAIGYDWREEKADLTPDNFLASGDAGYRALAATSGDFNVSEIFAEIDLPLLADRAGVNYLGVNAAARYSDYSTNVGGIFTYKTGIEYSPIPLLRFRTQYQRAVRAPNVGEMFNGGTVAFSIYTDYCNSATGDVATLCKNQGVSDPAAFQQDQNEVQFLVAGDENLAEEVADTYTIGVVFEPLAYLDITLDYYSIEIENYIGPFGNSATGIMKGCLGSLDANSDFCRSVSRNPNGQIGLINGSNVNNPFVKTSGIDLMANYGFDVRDGWLGFNLIANYVLENRILTHETADEINCVGVVGGSCPTGKNGAGNNTATPRYTVNLGASYSYGELITQLSARHIPAVEDFRGHISHAGPFEPNGFDSRTYLDVSFGLSLDDKYRIYGGINNLLDRDPPISGTQVTGFFTNTDTGTYDVNGRSFYLGMKALF